MTQEEFDKAPLLDQILYDTTGMLVENHKDVAEAMEIYHQAKLKLLGIGDIVGQSELLLDFVRWQNRSSKWVTIPESMVDNYLAWKNYISSNGKILAKDFMKVEIDCVDKYPMERRIKWQRWEAQFIVLEGDKSKTKRVVRKTFDAAYAVAKKWYDKAISDGLEVRVNGCVRF